MKYYVQFNEQAKHKYELVVVDEVGNEEIVALNKKTTDNYLHLPEDCVNATNRRLISIAMIEKANVDRFEITEKEFKAPRVLGPKTDTNRKQLEDYLEGEEREMFIELLEKAKKAREEANKKMPMSKEEKLLRRIARAQAELDALNAESETKND